MATMKDPKIKGNTIKIVQMIDLKGKALKDFEVAVDTVGAKAGDWVITVKSSSARMTRLTEDKPVDDAIVAIIDVIEDNGKIIYQV